MIQRRHPARQFGARCRLAHRPLDYLFPKLRYAHAVLPFEEARRSALMQDLIRLVTGRPADLLPFEEVREHLKLTNFVDRGIQEVPLDRIVGTVGREADFNRAFLPRTEAVRERWKRVRALAVGPAGYRPVELYKVSDVYFVVDGHHRVSVARSFGSPAIEAWVKEYLTRVSLDTDESLEDILLKGAMAGFLEATGLIQTDPDQYRLSDPGGYERLLEHIDVHRYYKNVEQNREISPAAAVESWRDTVYRPMTELIRQSGILQEFPGRTETDLYLYVMDHLHYLRERYGSATAAAAVADVQAARGRWRRWWKRVAAWVSSRAR